MNTQIITCPQCGRGYYSCNPHECPPEEPASIAPAGRVVWLTNWTDRPFMSKVVAETEQKKIEAPKLGKIWPMILITPDQLEQYGRECFEAGQASAYHDQIEGGTAYTHTFETWKRSGGGNG